MAGPTLLDLRKATYRIMGENAADISTDSTNPNFKDNPNYPLAVVDANINAARLWLIRSIALGRFMTSATADAVSTEVALNLTTFGGCLQIRFRQSSADDYQPPLQGYTEDELDNNKAGWRNQTASQPWGFVYREKIDGTATYQLVPTLEATVTSGLLVSYVSKPTALSAKTDIATELAHFEEYKLLVVPYKAAALMPYDIEDEEGAARVMRYDEAAEYNLAKCRKILKTSNGFRTSILGRRVSV